MNIFRRLTSGAGRRLGAWPLKLLGPRLRAEVVERACNDLITTTAIPGGHIRFFTFASPLIWRANSVLTKETDTIRWIDGFESDEVLWDIGANVGVYSLYAAIRKRVRVLSFEPSAGNYYVLTRNIQLNEVDDRVTAYCLALSGTTELGLLNMASPALGSALSQFGQRGETSRYWDGRCQAAVHGMVGFSIDEFVERFNPLFPNHLKLDVDGLELPILEGARATLGDPRLKSVMVELNLNDLKEKQSALHILEDAGFKLVSQGDVQRSEVEQAANHLFERVGAAVAGANR